MGNFSKKTEDYIGKTIDFITIIELNKRSKGLNLGTRTYAKCKCICGTIWETSLMSIKRGKTKSCGCMKKNLISKRFLLPNNQGAINEVYRDYQRSAKRRSISFSLTKEEFTSFIFSNCYYCNIEPQPSKTPLVHHKTDLHKDKFLEYNGIDRCDSSIGYTKLNCVTCCWICNRAKHIMSETEFKNWITRIVNYKWFLG